MFGPSPVRREQPSSRLFPAVRRERRRFSRGAKGTRKYCIRRKERPLPDAVRFALAQPILRDDFFVGKNSECRTESGSRWRQPILRDKCNEIRRKNNRNPPLPAASRCRESFPPKRAAEHPSCPASRCGPKARSLLRRRTTRSEWRHVGGGGFEGATGLCFWGRPQRLVGRAAVRYPVGDLFRQPATILWLRGKSAAAGASSSSFCGRCCCGGRCGRFLRRGQRGVRLRSAVNPAAGRAFGTRFEGERRGGNGGMSAEAVSKVLRGSAARSGCGRFSCVQWRADASLPGAHFSGKNGSALRRCLSRFEPRFAFGFGRKGWPVEKFSLDLFSRKPRCGTRSGKPDGRSGRSFL